MRIATAGTFSLLLLLAACGGDSTGPGDPDLANGTFRAQVDGQQFNAIAAAVLVTPDAPIIFSIAGAAANNHTLGFAWLDEGLGTYTISQAVGFNANYYEIGSTWYAVLGSEGSGSLTITTRTANRVAGTFSFVVVPSAGNATGTRTISNGSFDLTF